MKVLGFLPRSYRCTDYEILGLSIGGDRKTLNSRSSSVNAVSLRLTCAIYNPFSKKKEREAKRNEKKEWKKSWRRYEKRRKRVGREEEKASLGAVTITQDKEDRMWEDSKSLKTQPWCINTGEHEQ